MNFELYVLDVVKESLKRFVENEAEKIAEQSTIELRKRLVNFSGELVGKLNQNMRVDHDFQNDRLNLVIHIIAPKETPK